MSEREANEMKTSRIQTTEATKIYQIITPWLPVNAERMPWIVTLTGGREITVLCPLGAAVEVELAGYAITAQR